MMRHTRVWGAVLAALVSVWATDSLLLRAAPSPTPVLDWRFFGGSTQGMARVGDVLIVGGQFRWVAPSSGAVSHLYGLSPATGAVVATGLPTLDAAVAAASPDGSGGYYLAGAFTNIGVGAADRRVAHVLASGQVDAAFQPFGLTLSNLAAIIRVGSSLFLGGPASLVSGQNRPLVSIDPATGALSGWMPTLPQGDTRVWDLATDGTRLFVLSAQDSVATRYVSAWDVASGARLWVSDVTGAPGVLAPGKLALSNGRLLVGAGRLYSVDPATGVVDATWGAAPSSSARISAIAAAGATIYVAGTFDTFGGAPRTGLAAVSATTGALLPWNPQVIASQSPVLAASPSGTVFVGLCCFSNSSINGLSRSGVYEVDQSGAVTAFQPSAQTEEGVTFLHLAQTGTLLVSGAAAYTGRVARGGLAAFDTATGTLLPATIALTYGQTGVPQVNRVVAYEQTVFFSGTFDAVNGQTRNGLAAVDVPTGTVLAWPAPGIGPLSLDLIHGPWIYSSVSPRSTGRRVHAVTGVVDPVWAPTSVWVPQVVGKEFMGWRSTSSSGCGGVAILITLDQVTGASRDWAQIPNVQVVQLAGDGHTVYVRANPGDPRSGTCTSGVVLGALDRDTGARVSAPPVAGFFELVGTADGRLVVVGSPVAVGSTLTSGLVELRRPGGTGGFTAPFDSARVLGDLLVGSHRITSSASEFRVAAYRLTGVSVPSNLRSQPVGGSTLFTWDGMATPPAGGYVIEGGFAPGQTIAGLSVGNATSVSLPIGAGPLYVRVRAQGSTEVSNEIVAGCLAAPRPPTGLTTTLAGSNLTLAWSAPVGPVAGYTLLAGGTSGASTIRVPVAATPTSFGAAVPPGTYFVQVTAANACGTSGPSGEVWFTVGASEPLPGAPANLTTAIVGNTVSLQWTAPGGPVTGYVLEAGTDVGLADITTASLGPATSVTVPGVPAGVYLVRVRAVNAAGSGPPSADVVVRVP